MLDYAVLESVAQVLENAVWNPPPHDSTVATAATVGATNGDATSTPIGIAWSRLHAWLSDEETIVRSIALRTLDSCILACGTLRGRLQRKQLARTLIDCIAGDELAANRMDAAVLLGKLCCVLAIDEGASWLHELAYPILRSFLIQALPYSCARVLVDSYVAPTLSSSGAPTGSLHGGAGAGHRRSPSGAVLLQPDRPSSRHVSRSPSPAPVSSSSAAVASFSSGYGSRTAGEDLSTQASSLVCALEAFGYLLDSPAANVAGEADAIDDMLNTLLNQGDMDIFVRAQAVQLLATQLRHTYRNRRRIVKLMPVIKRMMSGGLTTQLVGISSLGSTSGNVLGSPDRLHPYLLRTLSHFVSTWYCQPPDRLLRRFPTPTMLKGYAARQFFKLTAGTGAVAPVSSAAQKRGHRKNQSSFSSSLQSSSSLSASVYSLLDSDQLGWANGKGVDALLQDLMKWSTKRTLLTLEASPRSDTPETKKLSTGLSGAATGASSSKPQHRGRTAPKGAGEVTAWNSAANASISLSNEEDFVNELLSQWSDISFNLRTDLTVQATVNGTAAGNLPPGSPMLSPQSSTSASSASKSGYGSGKLPTRTLGLQKSTSTPVPASTSATLLAARAARGIRSRTLEFDVKTHTRMLTLSNKSTRHAHDFFIQIHPAWLFSAEPSWGNLLPGGSVSVHIGFRPSPLDLAGLRVPGYLRVRSAHGFAMERVELVGVSGPSLRVLNANGGGAQDQLLQVSAGSGSTALTALSSTGAAAAEGVIDFGICFLGVSKVQHIYVQNITSVSTQAHIFYSGPDGDATASNGKAPSAPAFSVIPSLLFLRPHSTARVSIIFYPTSIAPVHHSSRISILGLGEEAYTYRLQGRGGIPLKVIPGEALDFGHVDQWKHGGRELAKEMNAREAQEIATGSIATTVNHSSANPPTHRAASAPFSRSGVYREWLTIINYNPHKSLPVSFRYNGQKYSMPSDGSDIDGALPGDSPDPSSRQSGTSTGGGSFGHLTQLEEFDVLYVKDTVIPPASTQRIRVTLIAHSAGSFSKRLYINTPMTPTDSMSILITAHIGPLLRVGNSAVLNLPPTAINTAVHYVIPIVNLSKMTLSNLEIQGLKRTPVYFGLSRMPAALSKAAKRKLKRASFVEPPDELSPSAPAAPTVEELNEYFDPPPNIGGGTCAMPNLGKDFLPSPIAMADFSTNFLAQFNDTSFTIQPYETLLLHLWFVTHIPGFYCIPFQVRTTQPYWNTYGPIEIKSVCLARSSVAADGILPTTGQTEGVGSAIHATEEPSNVFLLQSAFSNLAQSGVQFRGDLSSVSFQPFKKFTAAPGNKAVLGGFNPGASSDPNTPLVGQSYASEFVAVPSDRFDEELKSYLVPVHEGSGLDSDGFTHPHGVVDYLIYKLPNALSFSSTVLKLPPRIWLWNRKTLLLMLSNLSSDTQSFHTMLTFPFVSNFCAEIEKHAEYSSVDGSLVPLSSINAGQRKRESPNRVPAFKTAKIDLSLLSMEEWAGQKAALDAAMERTRAHAAAAHQAQLDNHLQQSLQYPMSLVSSGAGARSARGGLPSVSPARSRRTSFTGFFPDDGTSSVDATEDASGRVASKRYRPHEIATGYLAIIDEQNHVSVCVLRGMLGDLISIETPPKQLVFNCTTANTNAVTQSDSTVRPANPVTLYLKMHNHTDLNIAFGFKFGSAASEVVSTSVPTVNSGFSMLKPSPSVLTAYETRFVPITFAPNRLGKFSSDFIAFYKNPYQPSERFEFFRTKLVGNYIDEAMVDFEGEQITNAAASAIIGGTNVHGGANANATTSYIDCGTVVVAPTLTQSTSASMVPSSSLNASSPTTKSLPFALHNTSSQELMVTAISAAPFYVSLPAGDVATSSDGASASPSGSSRSISDQKESKQSSASSISEDSSASSVLLIPGNSSASRRKHAWAERRAARLRQKSGMSYVLDEPTTAGGSLPGSGLQASGDEKSELLTIPSTSVTQLLQALNSVHFRVSFRPSVALGAGAFSSQLIISYLHYFKLIDCFGWAGQLQLQSNLGAPTGSEDIAPTALLTSKQSAAAAAAASKKEEDAKSTAVVQDSPAFRNRIGIGYGGGMRHHREASMPVFTAPVSQMSSMDVFQQSMSHARHGSMNISKNAMPPTSAAANAAAGSIGPSSLPAIDLGLSPIKRMLKKSFTLTNTGSMAIHIGRIDILNAHGITFNKRASLGPAPSAAKPLTAKQGGMSWSFAHTTIMRGASQFDATSRADQPASPAANGVTKEFRQHTIASSADAGPGLNVHARHQLNATLLKSNALSNSIHKRRVAQIRTGTFDAVSSSTFSPAEGFAVEDLDASCVDWDEVDYQLEVENLTSSAAVNEAAAAASEMVAERRRSSRGLAAALSSGRRGSLHGDESKVEVNEADEAIETDGADEEEEEEDGSPGDLAKDFPITLHPGHSLPLWLWFYKETSGTYLHEVQISCIDPSIATSAATMLIASAASSLTPGGIALSGPPGLNRRGSLNSPLFIGTATMMSVLGTENKKPPSAAASYAATSAQLFRAAAAGDFSGWTSDGLRSLIFKTFSFLFRVAAQDVLKLESGYRLLDFGIVKLQNHTTSVNSLTTPSFAASGSNSKSMTFSFINEGSIPLHWRMLKLNVELSRVKVSKPQREMDVNESIGESGDDGAADYIDEERIHESACGIL